MKYTLLIRNDCHGKFEELLSFDWAERWEKKNFIYVKLKDEAWGRSIVSEMKFQEKTEN